MADDEKRPSRKRLATRQKISDAATRLFFQNGFDRVTVDDIAAAADVSRMTVFNHFARKEDMLFDLDEAARRDLLAALHGRPPEVPPIEALRRFAHHVVSHQHPYANLFDENSAKFMATVQASETLMARVRAIRDEFSDLLAIALAQSVGRSTPDAAASLAASLLLATWTTALTEANRVYTRYNNVARAKQIFFSLVDQGTRGIGCALQGSPYV